MKTNDASDFKVFLEENRMPPPGVEKQLFQRIHSALNPALYPTVAKLFGVHFAGSLLTLLLCPQFGVGISSPLASFTHWLMDIHPVLCFLACGSFWVFGGQGLISLCLTIDEKRVSNKYQLGTVFSQILLTILIFACFGYVTFDEWLAWWITGAMVTALVLAMFSNIRAVRRHASTFG